METNVTRIPSQDTDEAARSHGVKRAVEKAVDFLLASQTREGYWLGELEGDTILESEYIILMRFLGTGKASKLDKAAQFILSKQMDNGGWAIFPGGPVDVSASVKAYLALKLTIATGSEPYMEKAREAIREAGGVGAVNSYTRFYLAMLGQVPWDAAPAVPPEVMLLPKWFYFNIYAISSWSRTFVVPLGIIWSRKLTVPLTHRLGISELIGPEDLKRLRLGIKRPLVTWRNFFIAADALMKLAERLHLTPLRKRAVARAERWMLEHCEHSDGLGAIFPPIIYSLIAMRSLGYDAKDPQVERAMEELRRLEIEDDDTMRLQPCKSPVWDTAIVVNALAEAGLEPDHPAMIRAAEWLLSKEVMMCGDWRMKRPRLKPGGWYFEFNNDFYPDIDDTAMVLMALAKTGDVPGKNEACERALKWLRGMQGRDGGWASFDVNNNRRMFNHIPFADHNAMLDPSTSDITARILEMMSFFGRSQKDRFCRKAIGFLRREQDPDGSWYGRWGVNYVYGTWQAIRGLSRIGIDEHHPLIRRGAEWLLGVRNRDGGWGESCISYWDPARKGRGKSAPSQTAWAIMGLMSADLAGSEAVKAGVDYLIRTQTQDGTWSEDQFTGTGFPKVFLLKYHSYKHSFPTMALGMYRRLTDT